MNNRDFGLRGEEEAVNFLIKKGFKILCRNYRVSRMGEIDIIAEKDEYICFVEVKTRSSCLYGTPSEAVNPAKQRKIKRVSLAYLNYKRIDSPNIRFDVVEVYIKAEGEALKVKDITHIENAFC